MNDDKLVTHADLFAECGPLTMTWNHGWLCPFAEDVWKRNITCSEELRSRCNATLITSITVPNVPNKAHHIGRVICYPWANRLLDFYFSLDSSFLSDAEAANAIESVLRRSLWLAWRDELSGRKSGKRSRDWLRPIQPHRLLSQL